MDLDKAYSSTFKRVYLSLNLYTSVETQMLHYIIEVQVCLESLLRALSSYTFPAMQHRNAQGVVQVKLVN